MTAGRGDATAWCLTGAGHFLEESIELALRCSPVSFFLSGAAVEVVAMYRLTDRITASGNRVVREEGYSSPACGEMALGRFSRLVIAPATSNTVAKCALGIADTLPTNLFAQAGKALVPTIVLPTDGSDKAVSRDPAGRSFPVTTRNIDRRNLEALASFERVEIASSMEQLEQWLHTFS